MKIAIINNLYPPYVRGGAERVVERIVNEFDLRGHEVVLITSEPHRKKYKTQVTDNISSHVTAYHFFPWNIYYVLDDYKHSVPIRLLWHIIDTFNVFSARRVRDILQVERPDVVYTHNLKGLGLLIPYIIKRLGIKHVHTLHDVQLSFPSGLLLCGREKMWLESSFVRKIYERITRWIFRQPDIVISPSKFLMDFYCNRGFFSQSQKVILPNPPPNIQARERQGRGDGPYRMIYVGQLEDHKGINFLIDTLVERQSEFILHIAGEGTLADGIRQQSKEDKRIIYHGFVSIDQLVNLFQIVDTTVVPSLCYENSPMVIYESLQAGVPVVASNIGGVGELIVDGKNGFLFEPGNKEELLTALNKAWDIKEKLYADQQDIKKTAEGYAVSKYVDKLITLTVDDK